MGQRVGVVPDLGAGVGVEAWNGLAGVIEPVPVVAVVALRVDLAKRKGAGYTSVSLAEQVEAAGH